jgi:spore coat polysaccharide biosynthesis protein SpsF
MGMRIIAIVQTRMGSRRLPGKALMDLGGETSLGRVLRRLNRATLLDQITVATSYLSSDDEILDECARFNVECFRGSEVDVLDRCYNAANAYRADAIVRITADCPLIDPALVDETVRVFQTRQADYASNAIERTYPRGLDVEAFTLVGLKLAWQNARKPYEREHVTPYFYEHPELFRLASVVGTVDYSKYRWTLDTAEDLHLLRAIYERFEGDDTFTWRDVIALMEREPQLAELNCNVVQKSLQSS